MIPKVFHTVWVQGAPLPTSHTRWVESWQKHNPTYGHIVWSEKAYTPYLGDLTDVYATAVNHDQRAEIAQKAILAVFGGIYIDADFECFKPVDRFFTGRNHVVTWDETPGQLGNQIIGAPPNHPAVLLARDDIPRAIEYQRANSLPQPYGAGPHLVNRLWRNRPDVEIRPSHEFFPYLWDQQPPADYGDAYGAHHWTASWK